MIGQNRYLSINVHHSSTIFGSSRTAPLGLVQAYERATGEHLRDIICKRLETVGLTLQDLVFAATDGGSNVLKAVELLDLRKQQCFAHGLDLIVRKVIFRKKAVSFDLTILEEAAADDEDQFDDEEDDDDDYDEYQSDVENANEFDARAAEEEETT